MTRSRPAPVRAAVLVQPVEAWFTNPVAEYDPVQAKASQIVIMGERAD